MSGKLKTTLVAAPLVTAAVMALCWLTGLAAGWLGIELKPQPSLSALLNSRGWQLAANLAIVLVGAPVVEEALFRGLFYRLPVRLIGSGRPPGGHRPLSVFFAILSAGLFTAAHYLQMPFPDNAFLALFVLGLLQCRLYAKTGALWCPMLLHAIFNAINLALLFLFPSLA